MYIPVNGGLQEDPNCLKTSESSENYFQLFCLYIPIVGAFIL